MTRTGVVTDSTAQLPPALQERYDIAVVPLVVNWDNQTFRDAVDLSTTAFYQRLRTSKSLPTTGAPSLAAFEDAFRRQLERFDRVIAVTLAGKLSATHDVARRAAEAVDPTRIEVVDSGTLSVGLAWLTEQAAQMGEQGAELPQIVAALEEARARIRLFAIFDTLEFLKRGGRIGRAEALAGTLLNVKPIIVIRDGEVHPVERVRTMNAAMRRLLQLVVDQGPIQRLGVVHGDAPAAADEMERQLRPHFPHLPLDRSELSSVIGTHGGPGVVGVGVLLGG